MTLLLEDIESYKSYVTLCQSNIFINWVIRKDKRYLKKVLQKTQNINYQIPAKSKFLSRVDEKLIGKTILHLAVDYWHEFPGEEGMCESIAMLLDHHADVMIKDAKGLTALHTIMAQGVSLHRCMRSGPFTCGCIDRLLSAQIASNVYDNPCDGYGFSHFHVACIANNVTAVRFFLEHDVDINETVNMDSPHYAGFNALHFASNFCALETVEILLESGADLFQKSAMGLTPVHQLLVRSIASVNRRDYRQDFSEAILKDIDTNEKIMNIFLNNKRVRELGENDGIGLIILHLACTLKSESLIEQLLMADAVDVNQAVDINSNVCPGWTPLHIAATFNPKIATMLLKKGADAAIKDAKGKSVLDIYLEKYSVQDVHDVLSTQGTWKSILMSDGETKLLDLVKSMQDCTLFECFVEDLQAREQKEMFVPSDSPLWPGYTPLHLVVTFAERASAQYRNRECRNVKDHQTQIKMDLSIIEKCLQWNPKSVITQDARGSTPLHLAFCSEKAHVVELLLQHCGHENPVDEDNLSHLHIACVVGCRTSVDSLTKTSTGIDEKVDSNYMWFYCNRYGNPNQISRLEINRGYTPLHIAVVSKEYDIAKLLLERGADINVTHDDGKTPIHWLVRGVYSSWSSDAVKFLWTCPDLKDIGSNYLHVATRLQDFETVEELLKQGADAAKIVSTATRYAGCWPLEYFNENGSILDLMLQYGADVLAHTRGEPILKYILKSMKCSRILVSHLKQNEAEQTRIRESTGLTMLHLACYVLDLELVESLINDNVDVNTQIPQDSQFFPGCTSLHMLMLVGKKEDVLDPLFTEKFRSVRKLLLKNGANVASWSNKYGTPMHASVHHYAAVYPVTIICIHALLDKYANFSENPVDRNGVSLFHVACLVNDIRAAKKFLEHGVDVNIPVDYYINETSENKLAGQTPLHLCLTRQYSPRMVDLLFKYGANIDARDFFDNTPLHKAVSRNLRRKIYENIVAAGADVNAENVFGRTPLETALFSYKARARNLKFFFEHGHKRNYFNNITQAGYMPQVFENLNENRTHSLSDAMFNAPGFWEPDEMGRCPLHNVVSTYSVCCDKITHDQYVILIERITKRGYATDFQNKSGQTALHCASLFSNVRAVSALLLAGADINITDDKGDTPYSCAMNPYAATYDPRSYSHGSYQCEPVIKVLANHVQQLQFFDLHVNETNAKIQRELIERGYLDNMNLKKYLTIDMSITLEPYNGCPEELKAIQIGTSSYTFGNFLSDTGIVSSYPTMARENREAIDKFFEDNSLSRLEKTFGQNTKFLKLQYKKAIARKSLLEQAEISLLVLAQFLLPELCIQIIIRFLRNEDLKNVIVSTNQLCSQ